MPRPFATVATAPMGRLFLTQAALLFAGGTIAALTLLADLPYAADRLTIGLAVLVLVTAFVGIGARDGRTPIRLLVAIPLIDMLAVGVLRVATPTSGFGFVLVLPVAWLALNGGRRGAAVGVGATTLIAWLPLLLDAVGIDLSGGVGVPTAAATASLTVVVVVIAAVLSNTATRMSAQRRLLDDQARRSESAYQQAQRDEQVLNAVMDSVPFGVVSLDSDRRYLGANRTARAILRHVSLPIETLADQLPLYHLDGVTPVQLEDRPHVRGLEGEVVDGEVYWLGHPGESRVALEMTGRLLRNADRSVDRLVVVFRDVGDSIEAEAARDQAVASISHEFRTPLSAILGYIELAADTADLPVDAQDHLAVAERNTTRLLTLVNDLLATRGRTPRSSVPISLRSVDLAEVLADSVKAVRTLANDRLVTITVDAPPSVPILGDGFRLRQVLDNLVTNAIKYNVDGGSIAIDLVADDESASLSITDTGPGMSERERTEVFEPYVRTTSASASSAHGAGLGLAISRDIVEQHGGSVHLEAADTGGTVAVLELPRGKDVAA